MRELLIHLQYVNLPEVSHRNSSLHSGLKEKVFLHDNTMKHVAKITHDRKMNFG